MPGLKLNHVSERGLWWCIYVSVNWVTVSSGNYVPNYYLDQSKWAVGNKLHSEMQIISLKENVFEGVICKMKAIPFQPQCVK